MKIVRWMAVLCLIGCSARDRAVQRAVTDYNSALVTAYRTGNLQRLQNAAEPKEVRKVRALVDLKSSQGLVLEARLDSFRVTGVTKVGDTGALVVSHERWTYRDRSITPGRPAAPRFVADMTMQYECVRAGRVWRVRGVRTLRNDILEPRGFQLSSAHPEERRAAN